MSEYDNPDSPEYRETNVGMGMVPDREERLREDYVKRLRHAAGEFNNPSMDFIAVVRQMASTIHQLQGIIQDQDTERRRDALDGQAVLDEANNTVIHLQQELDKARGVFDKAVQFYIMGDPQQLIDYMTENVNFEDYMQRHAPSPVDTEGKQQENSNEV